MKSLRGCPCIFQFVQMSWSNGRILILFNLPKLHCSLAALESYWIISWQSAKPHYYYSASDHTWYWLWRQEALLRPFLPFAIEKTMDHKSSKIAHFCSLQIYKTKYYLVVTLRLRPSASPPILWRKRKVLEHALASYKSFKRPASGQLSPFS